MSKCVACHRSVSIWNILGNRAYGSLIFVIIIIVGILVFRGTKNAIVICGISMFF